MAKVSFFFLVFLIFFFSFYLFQIYIYNFVQPKMVLFWAVVGAIVLNNFEISTRLSEGIMGIKSQTI